MFLLDIKPLSHLGALPLRLHGVLKIPRAPSDRRVIWLFSWRWRCHGVLMAFSRRFHVYLGVSTELHVVPTTFFLAIACAYDACKFTIKRASYFPRHNSRSYRMNTRGRHSILKQTEITRNGLLYANLPSCPFA